MQDFKIFETRENYDFHDFYSAQNFNCTHHKDFININVFDIDSNTTRNIKINEPYICREENIESKRIIAAFLLLNNIYVFINIKTKSEKKNNFIYVLSGKNAQEQINTLKIQMYFNIYESARQDGVCRHLSKNLNVCQIQYDNQSNKFILLFESDNKTLIASLNYLLSIYSVATDLFFCKENDELICINYKPVMFVVSKKNEYKIAVLDDNKKSKKIYVVSCN